MIGTGHCHACNEWILAYPCVHCGTNAPTSEAPMSADAERTASILPWVKRNLSCKIGLHRWDVALLSCSECGVPDEVLKPIVERSLGKGSENARP